MKQRRMPRHRPGFTLFELLVVFTIIIILAAILFPVFAKAREKAQQSACQSNLAQISFALRMYSEGWNCRFPPAKPGLEALMPWLHDPDLLLCPSVRRHRSVTDYDYAPGFATDDNPEILLARDYERDIHNGGASYLSLDGHVKWMRNDHNKSIELGQILKGQR